MQAQKDLGFLMNPGEGPVTAVELYVPAEIGVATHLFSGGADGTLAVWSAGPAWDCLKVSTMSASPYMLHIRVCSSPAVKFLAGELYPTRFGQYAAHEAWHVLMSKCNMMAELCLFAGNDRSSQRNYSTVCAS